MTTEHTIALQGVDWASIPKLAPHEWPTIAQGPLAGDSVLAHMEPGVIEALAELRASLPDDYAIHPSPNWQGHVRYEGSSRHSLGYGLTYGLTSKARLSDATDVFLAWGHIWTAWAYAQRIPEIGGLGIYLDTHRSGVSTPMLHIDTRPERILWVRYTVQGEQRYVYEHSDPASFFSAIGARAKVA